MPDINMTELERQLKADKPSKVYMIYGTEAWLKRCAAERLLECCVPAEFTDFNYQRYNGRETDISTVLESAILYPVMAARKCVLLEDYDVTKASSEDFELLCRSIEELPDFCVFIIWFNAMDAGDKVARVSKLAQLCRRHGSVIKLDIPRSGELSRMLCDRAAGLGTKLSSSDAYHMIDRCGSDVTHLYSELDKMALYAGKKPITRDMIDSMCPASLEADVYKIAQNILGGRSDEAYRIITTLLSKKVEPIEIFSQLGTSFIDLYRAKAAVCAGMKLDELIESYSPEYSGREFRLRNAMRDCDAYSLATLRMFIDLLYSTEQKLKTAKADRRTALEQLVARLCAARKGMRV